MNQEEMVIEVEVRNSEKKKNPQQIKEERSGDCDNG